MKPTITKFKILAVFGMIGMLLFWLGNIYLYYLGVFDAREYFGPVISIVAVFNTMILVFLWMSVFEDSRERI